MNTARDHGGGLDAAVQRYGGAREDWLDLSTGINPVHYPVGPISSSAWAELPDRGAMDRLLAAARVFWNVPDEAEIVAANGASALIAAMPHVWRGTTVHIPGPTYNEHAAAFEANGWQVHRSKLGDLSVVVHPNNPDGRLWAAADVQSPAVIDESFCETCPDESHIERAGVEKVVILKSFGKFWGLAGLRLGFAICPRDLAQAFKDQIGPWAVAGPALEIGTRALQDAEWVRETRERLSQEAARLDRLTRWPLVGGTDLFRTYHVVDAAAMQAKLAEHRVWSRIFPYSRNWIRLGLPHPDRWAQVEAAFQ